MSSRQEMDLALAHVARDRELFDQIATQSGAGRMFRKFQQYKVSWEFQQLSLWDQQGSRVVRGNLLVIPIDQSFIYVEPVYLIAEDSEIPQLKRVIVSDGKRLAMEPTLYEALNIVFGPGTKDPTQASIGEKADGLSEARAAFATAEEALRDGDWDRFGRAMRQLKTLLGEE